MEASTYNSALKQFRSASSVPPFTIVGVMLDPKHKVLSQEFFNHSCSLAAIGQGRRNGRTTLQAISIKVNMNLAKYPATLLDAKMLLDPKITARPQSYTSIARNLVATPLDESSLLTFGPQFNPFGSAIIEFVAQIRTAIAAVNAESKGKCKFFFYSAPATEVDAKRLPWIAFSCVGTFVDVDICIGGAAL